MSDYSPIITLANLNTVYQDIIGRLHVASIYEFQGDATWEEILSKTGIKKGYVFNLTGDSFPDGSGLQKGSNIACIKDISAPVVTNDNWSEYWTEIGSYLDDAGLERSGFVNTTTQSFSGVKSFKDGIVIGLEDSDGTTEVTGNLNIKSGEADAVTAELNKLIVKDTATTNTATINSLKATTSLTSPTVEISNKLSVTGTDDTTVKTLIGTTCTLTPTSLLSIGTLELKDSSNNYKKLTVLNDSAVGTISSSNATLTASSLILCSTLSASGKTITSGGNVSIGSISSSGVLTASSNINCSSLVATSYTLTTSGNVGVSSIASSGTLTASSSISCKELSASSYTVTSSGKVSVGELKSSGTLTASDSISCKTLSVGDSTSGELITGSAKIGTSSSYSTIQYLSSGGDPISSHSTATPWVYISNSNLSIGGTIVGYKLSNAVWNDLADCLEVPEDTSLEYGKCYCFDGENYKLSSKHNDNGFIGIHSDTAGMKLGQKKAKTLDAAISGFVLAYTDKVYKCGTPLVCGKGGFLEKANLFDIIFKPYSIVATFWKEELNDEWGPKSDKIKVNGRNWVKVK